MPPKRTASSPRLKAAAITGGSVPGWSDSQNTVASQVMMYLMGDGLTKAGASGFVGNWYQESGLNAGEQNGYLAQWLGSRLSSLNSFAASMKKPVTSVEVQCKFALVELKTSYQSLYKFLCTTNDPKAAALAISNQYERPNAALANNANRVTQAVAAFNHLSGASGSGQASVTTDGSSGAAPSSILGLLTSPVETIGGWLASIAVTLIKDTAIGIGDVVIIPFWHWQQRSVMAYQEEMFSKSGGPMLLWTGAFWGLGYYLLFTDPATGSLKPVPVSQSHITKHARRLQSIPARRTLVKPKNVVERTPKKPTPVTSTTSIRKVRTMTTDRPHTVTVRSSDGRSDGDRRSEAETASSVKVEKVRVTRNRPPGKPNPSNRAGSSSLSDRRRFAENRTGKSSRSRS